MREARIGAGMIAALVAWALCACVTTPEPSRPAPPPPSAEGGARSGFEYLWLVTTQPSEARQGRDWSARVDFHGAPIVRDRAVILYARHLGNFPVGGLHQIFGRPGALEAHVIKIESDLAWMIPDPNYDGLAVIDYERWDVIWERTANVQSDLGPDDRDEDYRDDWRDYLLSREPDLMQRLSRPEQRDYFKRTWEEAARTFFLATINECKRLRPRAKWSFYGYPSRMYDRRETPAGVFGYGDLTHEASRVNDTLGWLWEAMDAVTPNVYQPRYTVADRRPREGAPENTPEQNREFIRTNVAEALRLARGKPVYVHIWACYDQAAGPGLHRTFVNDINMRQQLEVPAEAGANGVLIWHHLDGEERFRELQSYVRTTLAPIILDIERKRGAAR